MDGTSRIANCIVIDLRWQRSWDEWQWQLVKAAKKPKEQETWATPSPQPALATTSFQKSL